MVLVEVSGTEIHLRDNNDSVSHSLIMKNNVINKRKQQGFTLIELIAVIVILGILSAVAVPKFFNLQSAAIVATMHKISGAVESATTMANAQSIIDGNHRLATSTITVGSETIDMVYGYPAGTANGIAKLVDYKSGDWKSRASSLAGAWVYWHGSIAEDAGSAQCYVRYRQSTGANIRPNVNFVSQGC